MDPIVLAGTVVANFLLPYLKHGADWLLDQTTQKVGETAAQHAVGVAEKIWRRVRSVFTSDEDARRLDNFEKDPEGRQVLIQELLAEKLQQDSKLRDELGKLVQSGSPDGKGTGAQIFGQVIGFVDARGANVHGGVVAGYIKELQPKSDSPLGPPKSPPRL